MCRATTALAEKIIQRPRRVKHLTLIASLKCFDGLILGADSEEVISEPPLLRTQTEKLRPFQLPPMSGFSIVAAGAGERDYIGMIGDLIEEELSEGNLDQGRIDNAIRGSVARVFRDHARYENRPIDVKMIIANIADKPHSIAKLRVVSGAAVRNGSDVEAIGIGDATFKAIMDRFVIHGILSTVSTNASAARALMVYAMQQAKRSIPGIGGNTRIITMAQGEIKYMKSFSVAAIQGFFSSFDHKLRTHLQQLSPLSSPQRDPVELMIESIGEDTLKEYKQLKQDLKRIEDDDSLL